ncbi:MAG: phenylacetate--CoA ligase family protein [Gaiellaceae bacterium]
MTAVVLNPDRELMTAARRLAGSMTERDRWSRARLEAFQRRRLAALVAHAAKHSPLYRERYAGIPLGCEPDLPRLPPLERSDLAERLDRVVTDRRLAALTSRTAPREPGGVLLGRYRLLTTGGTSGEAITVVYDRQAWLHAMAMPLRSDDFAGIDPAAPGCRRASIWASHPVHLSRRTESAHPAAKRLRLRADEPWEDIIRALNRFQPNILSSYPSILRALAAEQRQGRLAIAPATVWCAGEPLTAGARASVHATWGSDLFDTYALTETAVIAVECPEHNGMHLLEDSVIVEVVDAGGAPVPDGEPGHHALVTTLFNYVQPLIRYVVPDIITLSPHPCACGRPYRLITSIEGRSDEILEVGGATLSGAELRRAFGQLPGLCDFQVTATDRGVDVAAVAEGVPTVAFRAAVRERLLAELERVGVQGWCEIDVRSVARLPRGDGGKLWSVAASAVPGHD